MRIALVLSLLIGILAVIFAVINPLAVNVNFGFATIAGASLPLVLISTLAIGVLIGYLVWLPARIAARKKIRSLERAAQRSVEPLTEPFIGSESEPTTPLPDDERTI